MCWVTPQDFRWAHSDNTETKVPSQIRYWSGVQREECANALCGEVECTGSFRYHMNKTDLVFVDAILT